MSAPISAALERSANGMTGPEWAWFVFANQTAIVALVALPVALATVAHGNQAAFDTTVGTAASCELIALVQATYYSIKNRDI